MKSRYSRVTAMAAAALALCSSMSPPRASAEDSPPPTAADHAQKQAALKAKLRDLPGFKEEIERIFKGFYDISFTDSNTYGLKDGVVTEDEIFKRKLSLPSHKETSEQLAADAVALMQSWQEPDHFPDDNPTDHKLNISQAITIQFQKINLKYGPVLKEVIDSLVEDRAVKVAEATAEIRSRKNRPEMDAVGAKRAKSTAARQQEKAFDEENKKFAEDSRKQAAKALSPMDVFKYAWELSR